MPEKAVKEGLDGRPTVKSWFDFKCDWRAGRLETQESKSLKATFSKSYYHDSMCYSIFRLTSDFMGFQVFKIKRLGYKLYK